MSFDHVTSASCAATGAANPATSNAAARLNVRPTFRVRLVICVLLLLRAAVPRSYWLSCAAMCP